VLVGSEFVEPQHQQHAEHHADDDHTGAECSAAKQCFSCIQAWQEQGKGTGGEHHARRYAQHAVFHTLGQTAQHQCRQRA